jgi:hypothetical protein
MEANNACVAGPRPGQNRLAAAIGFLWVVIMFGLTFADILAR